MIIRCEEGGMRHGYGDGEAFSGGPFRDLPHVKREKFPASAGDRDNADTVKSSAYEEMRGAVER